MAEKYNIYRNYYKILNKTLIRNKLFHVIFTVLDTMILAIKILDIYHTNYSSNPDKSINYLKPVYYFSNYSTILKLIPILVYLVIEYSFTIVYTMMRDYKKFNKKHNIAFVNILEFCLNRFLFIFYCEFLFSLESLYFLLFLALSLPFIIFIIIDMSIFHLTGFMLKIINFPFDDFSSLCDRQKLIIKILVSICSVTHSLDICKMMFLIQSFLTILFLIYNTYIIFKKSYFMMNNELFTKTRYSNLLTLGMIQILIFFQKPEEIFEKCYIILYICMLIFITLLIFLFYNPYNYIIIDSSENRVNLFYYFFLIDRNKNPTIYLEDKIKKHIFKCGKCSLCINYQKFILNHGVDSNFKNKEKDLFEILYSGNDKSMILFNHIINDIRNLGFNCVYKNSYYIINLIYIFYYSLENDNINFSLNLLLIFNLIQENNHALILNHRISIKQIIYINEFFILFKNVLAQIKEIISKNRLKRYINEFFKLSKMLAILNNSKFKEYLYDSKNEGVTNYAYIINICSFLYEEIFNKTISSYAIPIRENFQLHEDILKNYYKQNNHIILNFNLRTNECRIIFAGNDLYYYVNNNFYDLFPNIMKDVLIYDFCKIILNYKENIHNNKNNQKSSKTIKKQFIESNLIIKHDSEHIYYYWRLNLRLTLLFNDHMKESVLFNGVYYIDKNAVMTFMNKYGKEIICGYGNRNIMENAYKYKLNFIKFKDSDFMLNKNPHYINSISVNNNNFNIYTIKEKKSAKKYKKLKTKKNSVNEDILKINNESIMTNNNDKNVLTNSDKGSNIDDNSQSENSNFSSHNEKLKNIIEDTASLSSNLTKSNVSSFWNLSKGSSKDKENNFTSKKFFKLQMTLGLLLLALLILIIILIIRLNMLRNSISSYSQNYYNLRQFIRTFHQFSYSFLTVTCIVKSLNNSSECQEYLSEFNQVSNDKINFIKEQNKIITESCSDSISKIILNSETVQDQQLIDLLKGNFLYQIMNIKGIDGYYEMNYSDINISLSDALLLLSNNMRMIVSEESKVKTREKEPIYLIYGYKDPFHNLNKTEELSDYQTAVYSFILNYKSFVLRFASLNERLYDLIIIKNTSVSSTVNIFHNIIFVIMIFQLVNVLFYLFIYNTILTKIINSIILKFDITFDEEDDFLKLFSIKIDKLESIANIYSKNPISSINDINKNCIKYKNLINIQKKSKQKLNANKKVNEEEEENEIILFKDNQKYINWMDIYEKGYDRFYLSLVMIVALIDVIVYFVVYGIWINYGKKSKTTIELIYYTWNFERNTLRLVNFYHYMIFLNRTLDDITNDFFLGDNYTCVENLNKILFSYYEIRKKRKEISNIYRDFDYFCDYNCPALYDFLMKDGNGNTFYSTIIKMEQKYGENIEQIKQLFIEECQSTEAFLGTSVSQIFQSIYQKMIDAMTLLKDRSYEGIINKIFNSSLSNISSVFLNVTRYIIYIIGKVTYTDASHKIIEILESQIIITLVLYILSECILFILFFFLYIRNINIECKNMYTLKSVFEVTNLKE